LVIPSQVRREAGFEPGMRLSVRCRDGVVEIEPEASPVEIVRRGKLLVARPEAAAGPLSAATVERTRRDLHRGRGPRR